MRDFLPQLATGMVAGILLVTVLAQPILGAGFIVACILITLGALHWRDQRRARGQKKFRP